VEAPHPRWQSHIDWNGQTPIAEALAPVLKGLPAVDVVGHRIVHGGKAYRETTLLTPEVRAAIAQEAEFAPAHNRFELEAIEAIDADASGEEIAEHESAEQDPE